MGICFCPGLYSGPFSFVTWVSSQFKPWVEDGWYIFWTAGSNYKGPTNKVLATHSMYKKGCIWKNNQHIKTPHNYIKTISGVIVALKCLTYTTMIFYIIRFFGSFFRCFLILVGAPVWNTSQVFGHLWRSGGVWRPTDSGRFLSTLLGGLVQRRLETLNIW